MGWGPFLFFVVVFLIFKEKRKYSNIKVIIFCENDRLRLTELQQKTKLKIKKNRFCRKFSTVFSQLLIPNLTYSENHKLTPPMYQ